MKNWLIFLGGLVSGVVLTILVLLIVGLAGQKNGGLPGATFFDQPGEVVDVPAFKVMQAIQDNAALVNGKSADSFGESFFGDLYLMYNNTNHIYYDDEVIRVPKDKIVRQIGIYRYEAKIGRKTVPIIAIMDR